MQTENKFHAERARAIMRRYPGVRTLQGPHRRTALWGPFLVAVQLAASWACTDQPWWVILAAAWGFGAFVTHWSNAIIHESSHNLAARRPSSNKLAGIVANLAGVVPGAMAFRHFHRLHHRFIGRRGLDSDIPPTWEIALVGRSRVRKLLWVLALPLVYGVIHPLHVRRGLKLDAWLAANVVAVAAVDVLVLQLWGGTALAYLALSAYFAVGPHPCGAHILQEHINFEGEYETASYYGPINALSFNHGCHLEHHDFMGIAGPRLGLLRGIAPEFYRGQFAHRSRLACLWRFVTDRRIGIDSRPIRA